MTIGLGDEVGWWCPSLDDDGDGTTTLTDLSGNGNDGLFETIDGSAWETDTDSGGLRCIDLSGGYISLGHDVAFDFERTSAFTITGWIKAASLPGFSAIISKLDSDSPFRGYEFVAYSVGTSQGSAFHDYPSNAINRQCLAGTFNCIQDEWLPFAFRYNGSSAASGMQIYWSGVSQSLTTDFDSLSATIKNTIPLMIGARNGTLTTTLKFDDFRVFDRALTADEITHLASSRGVLGSPSSSIVCESGSFVLAGVAASLDTSERWAVIGGAFALAGPAVSFDLVARITGESGSFVVSGGGYDERYSRAIVANRGAFQLSGNFGLLVGPDVVVEAATGEFDLAGADAELIVGNNFSADTGTFVLSGQNAHQSLSTPAASGAFALAVGDYDDLIQPFFDGGAGAFVVGGGSVTMNKVPQAAAIHIYQHFFARS